MNATLLSDTKTLTLIRNISINVLLSLCLISCGSSNDDPAPTVPNDPTNTIPTAPANLTGVVYTETEIEIFWDAAVDDVAVTGYDVYRNGMQLATNLDARSYYDNTVIASTSYTYSVRAVDTEAARGPESSITLATPAQTPTIRQSNYFMIVGEVFDFFSHAAYDQRVKQAAQQAFEYTTIREYPLYYSNTSHAYYLEIDCVNGGLATERGSPVSCDGRCRSVTRLYYSCDVSGEVFSGRVDSDNDYSSNSLLFEELSIIQEDGRHLLMSGSLTGRQLGTKIDSAYERKALINRYESPAFEGATVVTDTDTRFSYGNIGATDPVGSARLSGSLVLRSPVTGNKRVAVTTPIEFVNDSSDDRRFPVGAMQILADDGSQLYLNADNGDPDTLDVTLTIDGSSDTFTERWDTWLDNLTW